MRAMSPVYDPRTWMETLPVRECWDLLQDAPVARLAVVIDQEPEVFPVTVAVTDTPSIAFRTAEGTKLSGIKGGQVVAVEVDGVDEAESTGWSVVARGPADQVLEAAAVEALERLDLEPWVPGHKTIWVEVVPDRVTGRRISPR